jgi:hypothetical protein
LRVSLASHWLYRLFWINAWILYRTAITVQIQVVSQYSADGIEKLWAHYDSRWASASTSKSRHRMIPPQYACDFFWGIRCRCQTRQDAGEWSRRGRPSRRWRVAGAGPGSGPAVFRFTPLPHPVPSGHALQTADVRTGISLRWVSRVFRPAAPSWWQRPPASIPFA